MKPWNVRAVLRNILDKIGLDATLYRTHSFCIGRATDMIKMGVEFERVKQIGRWRSNSIYRYINDI